MADPRIKRSVLGLPKQKTSGDAFTRMCAPLLNRRIIATHKGTYLIFGTLEEADNGVLRLSNVEIRTRDRTLRSIEVMVLNINVLSHVHEDHGDKA